MSAAEAVIFDVDGTLVDNVYFHVVAWRRACRDFDVSIDCSVLHRLIGMGGDQLTKQLVGRELPELAAAQGKYVQEYVAEVRPFHDAGRLIHELHRREVRIGVATSGAGDMAQVYLERVLDDTSIIDNIVTTDDVESTKPAPDLIAVALERSGLAASSVVMVGDTRWDVEAAARCGVRTIARSGGRSDAELRDAGAAAIYDDVGDLLTHLVESPLV